MDPQLPTPFDVVIQQISDNRFHNQRLELHSDIVGHGIYDDLTSTCEALADDVRAGRVKYWLNVPAPGARNRKVDLLVAEPLPDGSPDLTKMKIAVENKSVVTAHRNKDARYDDLMEMLQVLHKVQPEAILVATVMVGVADRVLNVPDRIKPLYQGRMNEFKFDVLPRLSSGDARLWAEFATAISKNRPDDPIKTVQRFRGLPLRKARHTHVVGYDFVLIAPVFIDNVNPPGIPRPNALGIDLDQEYQEMLAHVCRAYNARWHL